MTEVGLSNKLFVMAQAVLETGNFKAGFVVNTTTSLDYMIVGTKDLF